MRIIHQKYWGFFEVIRDCGNLAHGISLGKFDTLEQAQAFIKKHEGTKK
jgi:hypothetical protein